MDKESKDIELTGEQKTRLLNLGLGSKPRELSTDKVEQKADMLYDVLTRTLPVDPSVVDSLPDVVKGLSSRLQSLAGLPIGELLQDPMTDIAIIKKIKEYAKESGTTGSSEDKNEVFLAVYYAAIASALLFHNEKITQHSSKDMEQFFRSFIKKDWVIYELTELFKKAQEYCQKKTEEASNPSR